jgi:penicillin-binding protein 2
MNMRNKKFKPGTEIENPVIFSSIAGQSEEINEQKNITKTNLSIFWLILNLIFLLIIGKVFYLQVVRGDYYRSMAENNRIRSLEVKAPRGLIVDRNGEVLASNVPSFDLVLSPIEFFNNQANREKIYFEISRELDLNQEELKNKIERIEPEDKSRYIIKEAIDYEKALVLIEKIRGITGIYLEKNARRKYEKGESMANVIGYVGKINQEELEDNKEYSLTDYIGKNGLEYTYEKILKGQHGQVRVEVDSDGGIKQELGIRPPISGDKLVLNIDAGLQQKAYDVLREILEVNETATGGALVALDPRDGAVLALVSYPGYDNNLFAEGIKKEDFDKFLNDPLKPMNNKAISGVYPPGSVFKPLVASMGLEEGIISGDTTLNCIGSISINSWVFRDWKTHGLTDLNKAIAESCNTYFYAVGGGWNDIEGLGVGRMSKYSKYFGLGEVSGIDLPAEVSGTVPDNEWKFKNIGERWYIGDSYHLSIGQGFLATTPLQIANAMAVIANEGTLFQPRIVDGVIVESGQEYKNEKKIIRENFINGENFKKVKEAMRETVLTGSGRSLLDMETEVGGKTGTAQFGNLKNTHSWFVSIAPYDSPEIVTAVLIETGGEGHDWAVPATEQFLREYFEEEPEEIDWEEVKIRVRNRVNSEGDYR